MTVAPHWPGVLLTDTLAGQLMPGSCASLMVTIKLH
jgi:hypothetical protein